MDPKTRWKTVTLLFMLLVLVRGRAEDLGSSFDAANRLYEQGKFSDAAAAYQKLIGSGQVSAALFFNLGNAFLKSGQIGKAVGAYRSMARITPRDRDLGANLQFARKQVQGPSVSAGRWEEFLGKLTLNEWTLLASAGIWIWLLLLSAVQLRPSLKPVLRGYVIGLGIAMVFVCFCAGEVLYMDRACRTAIVVVKDAPVHNGPLDESQKSFVTHDGAELRVLDQKQEWLQVSAGAGKAGWLRQDQVVIVPGA